MRVRSVLASPALALALLGGISLPEGAYSQSIPDGPRQLSSDDIAKLRGRIASDKQKREEAAALAREEALRQEEERRIADAEAAAAAEYYQEPVQSVSAPNLMEVFANTFNDEMRKKAEANAQQQAYLNQVQRDAEARAAFAQQQREAQQRAEAVRREVEAARKKRAEASASAITVGTRLGATSAARERATGAAGAPSQATAAEERARKLREQSAAERQRLADAERQRVMAGFVEASRLRDQQQATSIESASVGTGTKPPGAITVVPAADRGGSQSTSSPTQSAAHSEAVSGRGFLRGFNGRSCAEAVRGAEQYGGDGSRFEVVEEVKMADGSCTVQGYLSARRGAVTRQ